MPRVQSGFMLKLVTVFVMVFVALAARASAADSKTVTITYDHFKINGDHSYSVRLAEGGYLIIKILNTCEKAFAYNYRGVERGVAPVEPPTFSEAGRCDVADLSPIEILYDPKFGAYIVEIRSHNGRPVPAQRKEENKEAKKKELKDVTLVIHVDRIGWDFELAGAFTTSLLTGPEFALETRTVKDVGEKQFVIRDRAAEDQEQLGFAGFIHVYHKRLPNLAGTFGLGVSESSDLNFFTGLSYRMGGKAFVTVGYNIGQVQRLPNGVSFDRPVMDSNVLNNLGNRTDGDWFFAVSYSFLNPGDDFFKKPFALPGKGD